MLGRDGLTGLVVLAASIALFVLTLGLKEHPLVPVGPGFYPRIVLGVTAAFAALLVVSDLLAHKRPRAAAPSALNYRLVVLLFAAFGGYVLVLPHIGFRIATLAFMVVAQTVLDPPRHWRRWIFVLVVALATTAVTYLVFERYLSVLLPRGRWLDF